LDVAWAGKDAEIDRAIDCGGRAHSIQGVSYSAMWNGVVVNSAGDEDEVFDAAIQKAMAKTDHFRASACRLLKRTYTHLRSLMHSTVCGMSTTGVPGSVVVGIKPRDGEINRRLYA